MAQTLRFRFSRSEKLKYIAHLDMLRLFERSIKRAGLPVAYTQGFNPRPKIVFGLPMSIGLTSDSEYVDIEFSRDISPDEFAEVLNRNLPDGVRVERAVPRTSGENIMNQITAARYEITFETDGQLSRSELDSHIHSFMEKEEVIIEKRTKSGTKPVNIRPWIYSMSACRMEARVIVLEAFLSAGTENNLRADLLLEAFSRETGIPCRVISIHRKALYASTYNEWKDPFEVAND